MMKPKWSVIGLSALILLVIAGCGDKPTAAPAQAASNVVSGAGENSQSVANDSGNEAASTPQPTADNKVTEVQPTNTPVTEDKVKESQNIEVYFTDAQFTDLTPSKTSISFSDAAEKYSEVFKALQNHENKDALSLWGKIELKSLKFADGQIVLDIHKPEDAQLGSGGESMAIDSLTKTYFQFAEVKSIEVLVDGEKVESLMGHVDLLHPMTRENSAK